jgi:integrase
MTNRMKLTKSNIEAVKSGSVVWDTEVTGFGVRRQRGAPVYILKTRIGSRQRWFTIGKHGTWTVEMARKKARAYLGDIAQGKDPATLRDADAQMPTISKAAELYLTTEVEPKKRKSTAAQYRDILERVCLPIVGQIRVHEIKPSDIAGIHLKQQSKPVTANRAIAVMSSLLGWCEHAGFRNKDSNPVRGIRKYKEKPRQRFLSDRELGRLGLALARAERNKTETPWVLATIRLLLFTGMRRSEVTTLLWPHVHLDKAMLMLPETKTGARAVYLSAPAMAVLSMLPRVAKNPHVIVGSKSGSHLVNIAKPWKRICKVARLRDVRIHDLRHSFASVGASGGVSLPIIGRLLGHSQMVTTERYSHLSADPVRAANEAMGSQIAAMLLGRRANTISFKSKASG